MRNLLARGSECTDARRRTTNFGLLLAALASFLYQVGAPDVPRSDIVQLTDAKVERAYKRCNRGRYFTTCWLIIEIEADGVHRELVQYDTPAARAALDTLRSANTITVLVSQVSTLGNELWFWEVRRAGEVLLSCEQTSKDELARNHRNRSSSFAVGGLSAVLLVIGAIVGIRQGVWRAVA
jgi:hypothetical protein